ncbi:hypothetical protein Vafri_6586 [Volvox africanus]|uniref:Uncharacterized protein n=1 Tax=Volvox africanus TaxID=51714 RepID=A0A8J4EW27_9CHLO|nr:hypothetical protein Vafri_6586 [Volvox africanus]
MIVNRICSPLGAHHEPAKEVIPKKSFQTTSVCPSRTLSRARRQHRTVRPAGDAALHGEAGLVVSWIFVHWRGSLAEDHGAGEVLEVGVHGQRQPELIREESLGGDLESQVEKGGMMWNVKERKIGTWRNAMGSRETTWSHRDARWF